LTPEERSDSVAAPAGIREGAKAAAAGVQFPGSGHSMTWSARASSDGGIVRPSARAVFWLIWR
jgi:hypothetical protein